MMTCPSKWQNFGKKCFECYRFYYKYSITNSHDKPCTFYKNECYVNSHVAIHVLVKSVTSYSKHRVDCHVSTYILIADVVSAVS